MNVLGNTVDQGLEIEQKKHILFTDQRQNMLINLL